MKKEISDHIAKAFFDKKVKKNRIEVLFLRAISVVAVLSLALAASVFFDSSVHKIPAEGQKLALIKHDGPYVLNFDFDNSSAKIESLVIDLPDIDLSGYKSLRFSLRLVGSTSHRKGIVKATLVNTRYEMSSLYISDAAPVWKKEELALKDFSSIVDWSHPSRLLFTLEEWNVSVPKGTLMVDDIEFVKKKARQRD